MISHELQALLRAKKLPTPIRKRITELRDEAANLESEVFGAFKALAKLAGRPDEQPSGIGALGMVGELRKRLENLPAIDCTQEALSILAEMDEAYACYPFNASVSKEALAKWGAFIRRLTGVSFSASSSDGTEPAIIDPARPQSTACDASF
jgi:hypothetical protein